MAERPPILVISGPVGAGKTTVAKLVVAEWGGPVAYLEGDAFWQFFATHAPAASPGEARQRDARIITQAMIASAARFARGGYDTVVDFTIGPWALDSIRTGLKDTPLDYVVIAPSADVCAARAAARKQGRVKDYAPYADLHAAFATLGPLESHAIRDDTADAAALAARIREGLAAGRYRV